MNTSNWSRVDLENWPRKEHYKYYTEFLKIDYSLTANLRVDRLLEFCRREGRKVYPTLIYLITKTVNRIDNLRMFKDAEGNLCLWDYLQPNYTIFHDDDKTFSDSWSEWSEDYGEFYDIVTHDMEKYKDVKGIKARPGQPPNFFCVSSVPWVTFTGYSSRVAGGEPQFFPIITAGKFEERDGETYMPVNMTIAHAVCDGYHTGLFFQTLQEEIDGLGGAEL